MRCVIIHFLRGTHKFILGTDHFLWVGGGGGGAVVSGGHPKIFELKGGGASQKLKAEQVFTGKCTGLMGHSTENWRGGGHAKFFRYNKKIKGPPPSTHKK